MRNWTYRRFSAAWRDATSPAVAACAAMTAFMSTGTPPRSCNGFLRTRAADFHEIGVTLPSAVITEGVWRDDSSGLKTATKPIDMRSKVSGFPDHFDDTSCVFRADDGRCSLQTLGRKNRPPSLVLQAAGLLAASNQCLAGTNYNLRREHRSVPLSGLRRVREPDLLRAYGGARPPGLRGIARGVGTSRTYSRAGPDEPVPGGRNRGRLNPPARRQFPAWQPMRSGAQNFAKIALTGSPSIGLIR